MSFINLIQLEGGAVVEFDRKDRIVPIGNDRGVPERFTLTHPGGPDQPSFRFEFGVMNGIPVCVGVHITAKEGVPVNTRDLTHNHIDKIVITAVGAVAHAAMSASKPGHSAWRREIGSTSFNVANVEAGRAAVKGKPRTRRKRDDVDLAQVAKTVRNATPGAKTQAVMTIFCCSRSTAERYVKRAREAGFLDD
jgi:hypothetical protein